MHTNCIIIGTWVDQDELVMFNRHCRSQTSNLPNSELKRIFKVAGFLGKNIIHLFELMKRSSLPQSQSLTFSICLRWGST